MVGLGYPADLAVVLQSLGQRVLSLLLVSPPVQGLASLVDDLATPVNDEAVCVRLDYDLVGGQFPVSALR